MNDQYYTAEPASASRPASCTALYRGYTLRFETVYKTARDDYPRVKAWILEHLDD